MFLRILNYSVRGLIVVIGILLLSGIILSEVDLQFRIMAGLIFVLFGTYRLAIYYSQEKRYKFLEEDDEN